MKSIVTLIASAFAVSAFAQAPAPAKKEEAKPAVTAPAAAPAKDAKPATPAKSEAKATTKDAKASK